MNEILKLTFQSFWHFCGMMMILGSVLNFIFLIYNRTIRHLNIRKHGWPPEHCDADGDFEDTDEEKLEL